MSRSARGGKALMAAGLALACAVASAQKTMTFGSRSMEPTVPAHSTITINLFSFLFSVPERGDIVVYRMPGGDAFFAHRVIGLPGDDIEYDRAKHLHINGGEIALTPAPGLPRAADWKPGAVAYVEQLPGARHYILVDPEAPALPEQFPAFPDAAFCKVKAGGFRCLVPPDTYFLMGDNRDLAKDSRYLGFIAAGEIGGRVIDAPVLP